MDLEQDTGKKRKRSEEDESELGEGTTAEGVMGDGRDVELKAILTHQLELEISLRKRVAKVIEARIAWAEQLKEAILHGQGTQATPDPVESKRRAMESFRALHAPLNLDSHTAHPRGSSILQFPYTPDPTPTPSSSTFKQLYFIPPTSPDTDFPPLLLLSCPHPSCPTPHPSGTLQGLLNHARIAHGPLYAYASHDEFLRAPGSSTLLDAVKDPEQYARVVAEGVRVKLGSVRGLKELFEDALEGAGLGFSTETPELAGLLGRKARTGEIRAFGQDEVVDVESVDEPGEQRWKKYGVWAPKRGTKRISVIEEGNEEGESDRQPTPASSVEQTRAPSTTQPAQSSSRFHIKKRVVVSDWSRSLRRADVQPNGPTHRWMIRVNAPSYSDHITTFVSSIRVQCASVPLFFEDTITCSAPPFVVSRLSKDPFLARITLVFADERTKDVVITHWVDLDPMRSGNAALGAEQIFDVELDRNAQLLPAYTSMDNTPNSRLWSVDQGISDKVAKGEEGNGPHSVAEVPKAEMVVKSEPSEEDAYLAEALTDGLEEDQVEPLHERLIPILNKLWAKLPLTLEDIRTGNTPLVPYTLFDTRSELLDAAHGRRKAVEWLYTRAMLDMLRAEYSAYDADLDPKLVEELGPSRLYAYLVAESIFPRPELDVSSAIVEEIPADERPKAPTEALVGPARYCGSCGLDVLRHPQTSRALEHSGFACLGPSSPQRPTCDIGLWTSLRPVRERIQCVNLTPGAITTLGTRASLRGASQLVECAHPQMTLAFHALTQSWGLKTFEYSAKRRNPANSSSLARVMETKLPLELLGVDASHVDRTLTPHALLALTAEVFIKRLAREAVRARTEMLREASQMAGPSVLTAAHVSRALMDGRNGEGWLPLMAVARIGIHHVDSILG